MQGNCKDTCSVEMKRRSHTRFGIVEPANNRVKPEPRKETEIGLSCLEGMARSAVGFQIGLQVVVLASRKLDYE